MKFFTFDKSHTSVFITILFVVFFGALYFFIYLPQNEKRVQQQRFRSLQTIDKNIHAKIDNSVALMNNLLQAYQKGKSKQDSVTAYIQGYPKEKFTLTVPIRKTAKEFAIREIKDSGYTITIDNNRRSIALRLQRQNIVGNDTVYYHMSMLFSLNQFITYLLPKNVFDEYIVFNDTAVVYETFASGINSLKDTANAKNDVVGSTVKSITAGGMDYKLFLQPISFTAQHKWVLGGLLSSKRYNQEKNQLPSNIVLLLVTAMLVIIVAFPWIKLYQMGNKDRLTTSDGVASIVVAMLLMSLLFFSFFKYNRILRPVESPDAKSILADQITEAFRSEIDTYYYRVKAVDQYVFDHRSYFKDINKLHSDSNNFKTGSAFKIDTIKSIVQDSNVNQIFWLDKKGDERANWIASEMNAPHGNFSNRAYFSRIEENKPYLINNDTSKRYYLDQVISWTTGNFTSVLSVPSVNQEGIAAISFKIKSLNSAILPTGYQFAIIDPSAKVLYHSDASRNLNENLIIELSAEERLISCLKAKTADLFTTDYFSNQYSVFVRPLKELPYYIVIFSDLSYKEARDLEIYSFTISMLTLLFAILILQLFVVFLLSSKRSVFKKQVFETGWIGPKITSLTEYNVAIVLNLLFIVLLFIFFGLSSFLAYIYILLFSVTFISLFLNGLFAKRYKKENRKDHYKFKIKTILWLVTFIVALSITAYKTLDHNSTFLFIVYQLIAFLIGLSLFLYGNQIVLPYLDKNEKWDYRRSFALMSLTRLIITSGIPVAFFYVSSYNYEQNITIRYRQLQYADQLVNNLSQDQLQKVRVNTSYDRGYYQDSAWIRNFAIVSNTRPAKYSEEDTITSRILGMFRIKFTDISVADDKFYVPHAADSSFFYNPLIKDACKRDSMTITYRRTHDPGRYLMIKSASLNYRIPSVCKSPFIKGFVFWTLLLGALTSFYFIIFNVINRLFALRLQDLSLWHKLDEKIFLNDELNNLVFIIGLPGSGKLTKIKDRIKAGTLVGKQKFLLEDADGELANVKIVDLLNIPDAGDEEKRNSACNDFTKDIFAEDDRYKLVIVNHFEYNIQDAVTNRIKLNFLERLMNQNKSKIIVLSTIHPTTFLDSSRDQAFKKVDHSIPIEDLERWHVLLGHFKIVILPLEKIEFKAADKSFESVYKETQYTHFLKNIQKSVIDITEEIPENTRASKTEQLAFKLQVTSHYFYMYIWQSLTKEEKFLLYDLAEDNLVNSFDDYNLNLLLAKGVIIKPEGTLQLFNKGFRNFILTAIGNTEAMKIKERIKDNGNWSSLRNPLLIVLFAILTFLLTFQEEAYSKIIAYVAALGTGIPTVIRLFSIFDKNAPAKD